MNALGILPIIFLSYLFQASYVQADYCAGHGKTEWSSIQRRPKYSIKVTIGVCCPIIRYSISIS